VGIVLQCQRYSRRDRKGTTTGHSWSVASDSAGSGCGDVLAQPPDLAYPSEWARIPSPIDEKTTAPRMQKPR
jgi:hypothetical protein